MRSTDFDAMVERAFARIPSRFRKRMHNVSIVIEDEPSRLQLARGHVPAGGTLLGLYEGRPLPFRSASDAFHLPDRITIFQGPHERMARTPEQLERIVGQTLWHEIAHYFGMDEKQVRAAERRREDRMRR